MELVVLPNIEHEAERSRAQDEFPQSAAGKNNHDNRTKICAESSGTVHVDEGLDVNVRLVDCVGYTVPGAKGYEDENGPRMINTPWYEEPIPFHEAAEIGTRKVIQEHSTIGVVVTTDGTIGEIPREDYIEAEERVIEELKEVGKPFIMIINTRTSHIIGTLKYLRQELSKKNRYPCLGDEC